MIRIMATFIAMVIFSSAASAQSDVSLSWSISGIESAQELRLDIGFGTRYASANGVIVPAAGEILVPIAGTCFETNQGGAHCSFSIQQGLTGILDLESSLNGALRIIDVSGAVSEEGSVALIEIF